MTVNTVLALATLDGATKNRDYTDPICVATPKVAEAEVRKAMLRDCRMSLSLCQ